MDDEELRQWLRGVSLALIRGLELPSWAEPAVSRSLKMVAPEELFELGETLGLVSGNDVRQLAGLCPNLPDMLSTEQGQQSIREWESKHCMVTGLKATRGVVKRVCSFWQKGVRPHLAVCRGIAVLSISALISGSSSLRDRIAGAIGHGADNTHLISQYGELVVEGDTEDVENIDNIISEYSGFKRWSQQLIAKAIELAKGRQRVTTCWEMAKTPMTEQSANGIRSWLFRR